MSTAPRTRSLTPKQAVFVSEYLKDLNATQAAIRAGYSKRTAQVIGAENLAKPMVQQAIQAGREILAEQAQRTALDVVQDIGRVRAHCMEMVPTEGGEAMRSPKEALKALELEGKHFGAFRDKLELTGADAGPLQVVIKQF